MVADAHPDFHRVRPPLEGRLVRLRAIEEDDVPRMSELFNDPEVLAFLGSVAFPQAPPQTREWWEGIRSDPAVVAFAIETLPGDLVGALGIHDISARTGAAGLGIWLGRPFWGRGYGTDAVRVACRFAVRELNLQRVELHVLASNVRGRRAYEKVGFREEGLLRRAMFVGGRPADVVVMGLLAEELVEDGAAPGV